MEGIFGPITQTYTQDIKPLPSEDFDLLVRNLAITNTTFEGSRGGKSAKRRYYVSHLLTAVCNLFKGDARIKVSEVLVGKNVEASGHIEFILERGRKRVCIVVAKKDDMDQGQAQCLIDCEIASDVNNLRVVYGIVTTFELWTFLRSCDDKIEQDETMLSVESGGVVDPASLMKIAGKIYAMLSDES